MALTFSDRRASHGEDLARALLDARGAVVFEQLTAAVPDADAGEIAAWLGHAVAEGLVAEGVTGDGDRRFELRARGRRILSAHRRAHEPRRRDAVA